MKKSLILLVLVIVLPSLLCINVLAADFNYVLSNSDDWKDVYSSMLYASLNQAGNDFLVSTAHGTIIMSNLPKQSKILVVSSKKRPYVFNYLDTLKSNGFVSVTESVVDSANIDLIKTMPNIDSFVFIGDSFGFNAIAVSPYAIQSNSWVFIANKGNINEIINILSSRTTRKVLIYGYVDKEVRDVLTSYNPEIIDNNDRFKDNVDIVKKYRETNPVKQIALSNGEFIEKELMNGKEPVLFTGRENVPDQIAEYLKNSDIEVGVLIGNELVGTAANIKKTTGLYVMVKFARGARSQVSGISEVEGLDLFPLPTPTMKISVYSIKYNKATSQLEITYKSDANIPVLFKGTITLTSSSDSIRVGDLQPVLIAPGGYKTVTYSVKIQSTDNLEAEIYTLYGDNPSSLEMVLSVKQKVDLVEVLDKCKFSEKDILSLRYNKQKQEFNLRVKNPNDVDCYVSLELIDVLIGYTKKTLSPENTIIIPSGKIGNIVIKQEMSDDDLKNNEFIKLNLYSGEKEDSLVNILSIDRFNLKVETLSILTYVVIILVVLIILLIIIIFIVKRREEYEE